MPDVTPEKPGQGWSHRNPRDFNTWLKVSLKNRNSVPKENKSWRLAVATFQGVHYQKQPMEVENVSEENDLPVDREICAFMSIYFSESVSERHTIFSK